jgi:hypothetical protein
MRNPEEDTDEDMGGDTDNPDIVDSEEDRRIEEVLRR